MKKLLVLSIAMVFSIYIWGQSAADYAFSKSTGTYSAITGTVSTATGDDGTELYTLPFTFRYCGADYTQITISTNGAVRFGTLDPYYLNNLASTTYKPVLAALWDDLYNDASGDVQYTTTGSSPSRILTIQWRNIRWSLSSGTQQNFQIKLFETTNVIQFIYGTMATPASSPSASIGINDATGGSGHFISVTPASTPTISTTTANNNISAITYLTSGLTYTFTPNNNCVGATTVLVDAAAITGDVAGATQSTTSICAATPDEDVWYKFTTTAALNYTITVVGSASFDAVVELRSGACNGTNVACADDTGDGGTETIVSALSASTTYLIRVWDYGTGMPATTTFTIRVESPGDMSYVLSTTTQTNTNNVATGTTDAEIIGIQIVTAGTSNPLSATQFTVNANGSTSISDINATNSAKIYYTGTSGIFSTTTLFGQATPTITNFDISGSQVLSGGTNYFWLVYDIKAGATVNNVVDGECTSLTVSSARTPTITAPSGNRIIKNVVTFPSANTNTSSSRYPLGTYWGYQRHGSIYTTSELGLAAGSIITSISYYINSLNTPGNAPAKIYMKMTSASTFTAGTYAALISDATLVYDATISAGSLVAGAWNQITLSTQFTIGSTNLMILVETNATANGNEGSTAKQFRHGPAVTNCAQYWEADTSPPAGNGTLTGSRPNIQIEYSSPAAKSLSGITYNQASTAQVATGSTNQEILRLDFEVSGATGTLNLNSIVVTSNNTSDADISNVKLFRTATTSFSTDNQLGTSQSFSGGTATFSSLSYDLPGAATTYIWVAYDIDAAATINNTADAKITANNIDVDGSTYPGTDQSPAGGRTIKGPLAGDYTVGAGQDYTTLTAAVDDLNALGISASVNFLLTDATYSTSETFPILIDPITGSGAANIVTIKPNTAVTSTITGSSTTGIIVLYGCDYVTIEGSNSGSTDRSLTIENSNTAANTYVVGLFNSGGADGAKNCTVKNTNIKATGEVTNNQYGILLNYSGGDFDNTVIDNNKIFKCRTGIQFAGVTGGITNDGQITNNIIGDATDPVTYDGIDVLYADNTLISGNEIFGNASGNENTYQTGIFLGTGSTTSKIRKNRIHDFYYTGTGGYGCFGIYYYSDATTETEISNNVIYAIKADGDATDIEYVPQGIFIASGGNCKIYYNSIYLSGNTLGKGTSYTGMSMCIGIAAAVTVLDIRNNALQNSMGEYPGSTMTNVCYVFYSGSANTAFTDINYNDYYFTDQTDVTESLGFLTSARADLAAWQTATGKDANSISADPLFTSVSNLYPQAVSPVIAAGTPLAGVTTDITGATRSLTASTIGAYEVIATALTWTGTTDDDWNKSTNWNPDGVPFTSTSVTIPNVTNDPVIYQDVTTPAQCNAMTIASGAVLTINAGKALTVGGTLANNAGNAGLVVKSDATGTGSLIHSTADVDGTFERFMNNADWTDWMDGWHFLGSPVAAQAISPAFTTSPATGYDLYCWYEPSNLWVNYKNATTAPTWITANGSDNFTVGRGYMAAYDEAATKSFAGKLNVGDVNVTGLTISGSLDNRSWHLLGNPFGSAVTWDASSAWAFTNIAGVAKIWNESQQSYSDLTSYPPMLIPATNGFMVQVSTGTGSLTIPATKRTHSAQAFYKTTIPGVKLIVRNTAAGNAQESSVYFNPDATTGFDLMFDGEFLPGYGPVFHSSAGNIDLSTNSLPGLSEQTAIPFTFVPNNGVSFSIEASGLETVMGTPWLMDKKTGTDHNLKLDPVYQFTASGSDDPSRFLLHFSNVGLGESRIPHPVSVYASGNTINIIILVGTTLPGDVYVYNMMGQRVMYQKLTGSSLNRINLNAPTGYYLVKVITSDHVYSEKVFIVQ